MQVHIFLLCYNEEAVLPSTLEHYRARFPSAVITLLDNHSTDRSAEIAAAQGCRVVQYESGEQQDEMLLRWVRSHLWRQYVEGDAWVIMCDMDEWLQATEADLRSELERGCTVLKTQGVNMVGAALAPDASDLRLADIAQGFFDENYSKWVCFYYPTVRMEYGWGAHSADAQGNPVFSAATYELRHYDCLGVEYLVEKQRRRWERNEKSRAMGMNGHYCNERAKVVERYQQFAAQAVPMP